MSKTEEQNRKTVEAGERELGKELGKTFIGEMIALRKAEKVTQSDLVELTGSRQQVISRIEKKENNPSLRFFCNMPSALGYELWIVKRGEL